MTIGQLIETLTGKVAALEGQEIDGSAFGNFDLDDIKQRLKALGYEENGFETMYNGMTGRKLQRMIFLGPTYYQRLKHMVADKIHCLTMDHDVLTFAGWKSFNDITMDDKIATLKDGKLVYEKPLALLHYPEFEGKLYHIKSQQIDLQVTDNHRMWVSKSYGRKRIWQPYELIEAKDIKGKHVKYQKDANWNAPDYQFILPSIIYDNNVVKPEKHFDMNAWLTLFGIWMAEGWTESSKDKRWPDSCSYIVTICQCKERVKKMIYAAITKLGYHYRCDGEKIRIADKQLYEFFNPLSVYAPNKTLPEWVWSLSTKQCQLLMNSMILGDGSYYGDTSSCYYTSSIKLRDDVMRLCLHAGWSGNISLHIKKGHETIIEGRRVVSNYDMWRIGLVKAKNNPAVNHGHTKKQNVQVEEIFESKEPVFCLQVPSEVFYVRRNGLGVWTGNSRSRGPHTILTRQPPEGRSRDGGLRFGEMERDCMLSYGLAKFLKERLLETSDIYSCYVCDKCGLFAQRMLRKDNKPYPTKKDIYFCPACRNYTDISKIRIPYAFKLFIQEMMAMNICPRIRVKKSASG
jgi:hypothetical protein